MNLMLLFFIGFTLPGVSAQGDRIFYSDARSLGLGGVSAVLENFDNPATSGLAGKAVFELSGVIFSGSESRGLRVYDSYGNNIGIRSIASNRFEVADAGSCGLLVPLRILRAGVKYQQLWDFNYYYQHEYRDDFYQVTKIVEDSYNGKVYSAAPFIGLNHKILSFGIEEDFLYGNKKEQHNIIIPQGSDSVAEMASRFNGRRTKLGLVIKPGINFRFGYSFANRYELKDGNSDTMSYPSAHALAFFYQPPGRVPTKFVAEVAYEAWTDPIYIYKFGIEHTIVYKYALRYGFCIYPDYAEPAIWTTVLTLGFGINTAQYYFDFGYGYAKRNYANTDFGGLDITEKNIFDESASQFLLSIGLYF